MKNEAFKKKVLMELEKQLSNFIDNSGHVGEITSVEIREGAVGFEYLNPLNNNTVDSGYIKLEIYS